MTSSERTPAALWFLAGAFIAVLAMHLGPTREIHTTTPVIIRTELATPTTTDQPDGGPLLGPGLRGP